MSAADTLLVKGGREKTNTTSSLVSCGNLSVCSIKVATQCGNSETDLRSGAKRTQGRRWAGGL